MIPFNLGVGSGQTIDIGDNIANSLMLDSASSQYLSKTFAGAGNRRTFTINWKGKRGKLGVTQSIADAAVGGSEDRISFNSDDTLWVGFNGVTYYVKTNRVFRDPAAWLDITIRVDTTDATPANRIRAYEGQTELTYSATNYMAQNYDCGFNNAVAHSIGRAAAAQYFDGYLTAYRMIAGSSLAPTDFNRVSADTGQVVNKTYAGSYAGTNSYYLDFANSADLGNDVSGNNNDWTLNGGISSANQYTDTPTNSYAVLNPLAKATNVTIAVGNTAAYSSSGWTTTPSTLAIPATGIWYFEWVYTSSTPAAECGICTAVSGSAAQLGSLATGYSYNYNGTKYNNGSGVAYGATYTTGDVIGVELNMNTGALTFFKNNATQGTAYTVSTSLQYYFATSSATSTAGQAPVSRFDTARFSYPTRSSGALALCTANLP